MPHKLVNVFLANSSNEEFKLTYQIRPDEFGQIWADCLRKALGSGLREHNRLYGFNPAPQTEIEKLFVWMDSLITDLNKIQPELRMPLLDHSDLNASLNNLHTNFADSHLVTSQLTDKNMKLWSEFNMVLHMIESFLQHQSSLSKSNFPLSRIVFTWNDPQRVEILPDQYEEFDLEQTFGTAYFCYSQVGIQIFEIYLAKDATVPHAHIQPARYFSADTVLWFGAEMGHASKVHVKKGMQGWFEEHFDLKKILGLEWGDKRLSIGQVPVGRLVNLPYSDSERKALIQKISKFETVSRVELE